MPLAVLGVSEQPLDGETLNILQAELPRPSSNRVHRALVGATHEDLVSIRERALMVADTIRQVVDAGISGRPLAANTASEAQPLPVTAARALGPSGINPWIRPRADAPLPASIRRSHTAPRGYGRHERSQAP